MTKKTIQARDFMSLTSRQMTAEGYMVAPGNLPAAASRSTGPTSSASTPTAWTR